MRLPVALKEARACVVCAPHLPGPPRPLVQGSAKSRILIVGQAPGAAADASGVPWDDRSGARLREWLALTPEQFYDPALVAMMPMGFCYPGTGKSGDAPPRPECAPLWHERLLRAFRGVELTIYLGQHALKRYLAPEYASISSAVAAHKELLPARIALPHPSPRNNIWLKKNPWFERDALPPLRERVGGLVRSA